MKGATWTVVVLGMLLFLSAVGQVYVVHLNRTSFAELQRLQAARDELNIDWGRLQIEQAAWSTHARIEQVATQRLQMRLPDPAHVVIVRR